MFERFTERAQRAIFFARYEASQFGSATITDELLMLGMLREDRKAFSDEPTSQMLIRDIRLEVEQRIPKNEKIPTSQDIPITDAVKRILAYSLEEADRLNDATIRVEHLVLGTLREEECGAAQILRNHGFSLSVQRERWRGSRELQKVAPPVEIRFISEHGDPRQILLFLLREPQSPVAQFLHQHGVTVESIAKELGG